ncbi:BH3-interacting domain death agonist-like [Brachionichthys hirsutus]|uniref:BH3-interacting domain death agonist-like n=1 Tax=Brachionichthys hirsutus TaxID=412623 RepID=UPI003604A5E9
MNQEAPSLRRTERAGAPRTEQVEMSIQGNLSSGENGAMVMLAFLQADCRNPDYREELISLGQDLNLTWDVDFSGWREDIEFDGFLSSSISAGIRDIQPSVELQRPGDRVVDAAAVRRVVAELREIADHFEHDVVARATQNLSRSIETYPLHEWTNSISSAVDSVRRGMYLSDLPQERVVMALTLTLVQGVCERNPLRLRSLFGSALQYIGRARPR